MKLAFISSLLRRDYGNIENPNVPLTGTNLTAAQVFGNRNMVDAGVNVTDQTALELPPIWAGINVIAGGVSKLPLNVFRRDGKGIEKDTQHAGHRLMQRPNSILRPSQFKQLMMFQALMYGNHVSIILRDRNAEPVELLPTAPSQTRVFSRNGEYWYECWINNVQVFRPAVDIFHIKAMGFDGILGSALCTYGRQAIGSSIALNRYSASFFRNSGRPSAVIKHPGQLDDEAAKRLRESWQDMYGGSTNAGKTAVMEEGMEIQLLGFNLKDMDAVNQANFNIREVCRLLNIQPHKLADLENASLRSVPEANQQFLDDTLEPWLTQIEEECGEKFLTEIQKDGDTHYFDFDVNKLLRMNPKERAETERTLIESRIKSPNEARETLGLNPYEGGDKFENPNTSAPQADVPSEPAKEDAPADTGRAERDAAHLRLIICDTVTKMITRIGKRARAEAKHDATFEAWFEDGLIVNFRPDFIRAMAPCCGLASRDGYGIADAAALVDSLLVEIQNDLNQAYSTQTRETFSQAVDAACTRHEQELADKIADTILEVNKNGSIAA